MHALALSAQRFKERETRPKQRFPMIGARGNRRSSQKLGIGTFPCFLSTWPRRKLRPLSLSLGARVAGSGEAARATRARRADGRALRSGAMNGAPYKVLSALIVRSRLDAQGSPVSVGQQQRAGRRRRGAGRRPSGRLLAVAPQTPAEDRKRQQVRLGSSFFE